MELTKIKPFKVVGNLYFVGSKQASCHVIDTGDGLIMIDTGYEASVPGILESMAELGLDPAEIKVILHSHGHGDHTFATPGILEHAPAAETYLNFNDIKYLGNRFMPDHDIKDGDVIKLGNTEVLCLFTPGHTEGVSSFFFNVEEDGATYRCGMFGGAGVNQIKWKVFDKYNVPYRMRREFLASTRRLMSEKVDVVVGNHVGQCDTYGKLERLANGEKNPFIDPTEWGRFLEKQIVRIEETIKNDARDSFINYAHRGAPAYCPENTMLSFYTGLYMGSNGIETDVQKTKDGVLVLFHDDNLERLLGIEGCIADYTYEELRKYDIVNGDLRDKIPTFEDFLTHFSHFNITFAIELKVAGIEREVAAMIYRFGVEKKVVITSFIFDAVAEMRKCAPELRTGYLVRLYRNPDDKKLENAYNEAVRRADEAGIDELCPSARDITPELVEAWHRLGFRVRAWDIKDEEIMRYTYDSGADGMTCNFPDKLTEYIKSKKENQ